jgi:6-phosphogluconate dehydrogenase (decarboxylating)
MRAEIVALRAELESDDFVHDAGKICFERTRQRNNSQTVVAISIVAKSVGLSDGVHAGRRGGEVLTILAAAPLRERT